MASAVLSSLQLLGVLLVGSVTWVTAKLLLKKPEFPEVPGPEPASFLFGDMMRLFHPYEGYKYHLNMVKQYAGRVIRINQYINTRTLYIYDPKALYHILIKDHGVWEEAEDIMRMNTIFFGQGIVSTTGEAHRKQRKLLNPVFSMAHMRAMTPIFYGVVHKLTESIKKEVKGGKSEIDMLDWMSRASLEMIGQSGFGYSFDSMEPNSPPHPFSVSLKNLFPATVKRDLIFGRYLILPYVYNLGPKRFRRFAVDALCLVWKNLRVIRDIINVVDQTATEILQANKEAAASGKHRASSLAGGKDLLSLLVKANLSASEKDKISDEELAGQVSAFSFAAMDTSSNALASMLHLLSLHPEVQEKLREEVTEAYENQGGDLDYSTLMGLPFLDAVVRETLRLWPPVTNLLRQTMQSTVLPFETPITTPDGKQISEIFVPANTRVLISVLSTNRDPKTWGPDASEWKPERWANPLPQAVIDAPIPSVYSNLLTFIGGQRACIGFKFAELEIKIVLSMLIKNFKFQPSGKKVIFQMAGISQPTTKEAEILPSGARKFELPLNVDLA